MRIRHETPMPDFSFTIHAPLRLEVEGGVVLHVTEWSLEGIVPPANLRSDGGYGTLFLNFQGFDIGMQVELERDPDRDFMRFVNLSNRQYELLLQFYRGIVSGQMEPVEETITSIDTPVELISMEETENERKEAVKKESPRVLRAAFAICFYLALAVTVFGSISAQFWQGLTTLALQGAVIEAPLERLSAPADLHIVQVHVRPDTTVNRGQIVASGLPAEMHAALQAVDARIALVSDELSSMVVDITPTTGLLPRVYRGGFAPRGPDRDTLPSEKEGALRDLLAELDTTRARLQEEAALLHIRAPANAVVRQVNISAGTDVAADQPIMTLERDSLRLANGHLATDLLDRVHVGQKAEISFNTQGTAESHNAEVSAILRHPETGALQIMVSPTDLSIADARQILQAEMPVDVRLTRQIQPLARLSARVRETWVARGALP